MHETGLRQPIAGIMIALALLLQIAGFTGWMSTALAVSYLLWLGVALLWRDIPRRSRLQAGALIITGLGMLVVARLVYGAVIDWPRVLTGNTFVVAMLVGVSFIALIGKKPGDQSASGQSVTGAGGIFRTWLGVHFLGTILNLSTVFMVGDRLARQRPLNMPQFLALNRGLSSAALWSPFFASMGVVMALVPNMNYLAIATLGFPLAMLAGLFTALELGQRFDLSETAGFSLAPSSLFMPVGMAMLVMVFHFVITPELSIVSIITFLLPLVALLTNLPAGLQWSLQRFTRHALERLPTMRGEISLFLAAGVLTLGLSTLVSAATHDSWSLFAQFGAFQASVSFLAITLSGLLGLHPIIGVSVLASMLSLEGDEQTLFAFVALTAWSMGASVGPLSGINLSLQGRYGISGYRLMKDNLIYVGVMSTVIVVLISLLATWLHH